MVEEFFRSSFATDNALITEAVRRMLDAGGKRLRPRFTLLAAEAAGGRAEDHLQLAAFMELIHVATLIHDDVVDGAETRRGVNATAVDFGNRISVLAGDYLFAWIFKNVTAGYAHPIPHILSSTLADITDGEVLQLKALADPDTTLAAYVEVATKKTASLFAASAECGALAAGAGPFAVKALREFGTAFGIAFQMRDDLLDLTADEATLGKPVGNDLRERKMTVPLVLALEAGDREFRSAVERFFAADGESPEARRGDRRRDRRSGRAHEDGSRPGGVRRTCETVARAARKRPRPHRTRRARGRPALKSETRMFSPIEIAAVVGVAILVFGADKLPKLARSAGQAKKEFMVGQAEADVAAERARDEARRKAEAEAEVAAAAKATSVNGVGQPTIVPDPQTGAPGPTTIARPIE